MKYNKIEPRPFIKWVGGKSQLLQQLSRLLPDNFSQWENVTYIEPFVGGGAMLFFMLQRFHNIKRVIINDINRNLTDTYKVIKSSPEKLINCLRDIENQYFLLSTQELRKEFYLKMRNCFNEEYLAEVEKSAVLIFLNRTCFNGLYRENSKGKFNVPFGRYANPTICNEEVIYADSYVLNEFDVQILNCDFEIVSQYLDINSPNYIYFDPPYRPLNATSSFNSYVKESFDDYSQIALAAFCRQISKKENVFWMLSNADCSSHNPEDTFFEELYKGFDFNRVYASRMVNANASKRGKLTELLIRNYITVEIQMPTMIEQDLFSKAI